MRKFTPKFILTALLFLTVTLKAQIFTNGSFELWPNGCPVNTAPNNWTNFSTSLGPDQAGTCAGVVVSYSGSSHMNLVWANTGLREGAKQAVTGLNIGSLYMIRFQSIQDQGLYASTGSVILDVYHNSTVIYSTPEQFNGGSWVYDYIFFTALATTDTIGFQIRPGTVGTSGSVGVDDVSVIFASSVNTVLPAINFSIYPNPSNGVFTIQTSETEKQQIEIYTVLGELIYSSELQTTNSELDLRSKSKGIYFVKIIAGNKSAVQKLIIQ